MIYMRPFETADAPMVAEIIRRNLQEINKKDYTAEQIERWVSFFTSEQLILLAQERDIYVILEGNALAGTASVTKKIEEDTAYILTVFVLPELQQKGLGRALMAMVEDKARRNGARYVKVPASKTARKFYEILGYTYLDTAETPDEDGNYMMQKELGLHGCESCKSGACNTCEAANCH
ncbi:MAG: GNAT family N-acetyltransferase [Christensenellaceae bacterium]|jgi:GNAT superfamily N-acetyltransferase